MWCIEMVENKIAIITCVNDEKAYKNSLVCLQELIIPKGFEIEVVAVRMASSLANGYQEGMRSSDARYKIYLQQDVCLLEPGFLLEVVQCFRMDRMLGVIGLTGAIGLSEQLVWFESDQSFGRECFLDKKGGIIRNSYGEIERACQVVEAVCGAVFATQYDLDWREDLFDGCSCYDLAQSYEFRKKGYKVAVLRQGSDYYVHTLANHGWKDDVEVYRTSFCKEYEIAGKGKRNLTSIIILTYNQLEYTKLCIESIRRCTRRGSYEIIVVDNHSSDGTVAWLKMQSDIQAVFNSRNEGFPKGCNQGIAIAQGTEILLLNNDTIVTSHWLEDLCEVLYSDSKIGAVGPVSNSVSNCQKIEVSYRDLNGIAKFSARNRNENRHMVEEKHRLIGFCFLIKRNVMEKVGLLEEGFSPGNCEDDDYSLRILQAGYRLFLCKGVFVHHFGGASFHRDAAFDALLKRNHMVFRGKWGFAVDDITDYYPQVCEIDDFSKKNPDIVCLGTAGGAQMLAWKARFPNARVCGVEANEKLASFAGFFGEVYQGSIEEFITKNSGRRFDIVAADSYLQKLYDPWACLENVRCLLKKDGRLVLSLPNMLDCAVIGRLLAGRWKYNDENGVMSKKNIRYFTVEESKLMLAEAGYEVVQIRCIVRDKTPMERHLAEKLAQTGLMSNLRDLDFDTFIMEAKLKSES